MVVSVTKATKGEIWKTSNSMRRCPLGTSTLMIATDALRPLYEAIWKDFCRRPTEGIASGRGAHYYQQLFTTSLQFPAYKVTIGTLRAS